MAITEKDFAASQPGVNDLYQALAKQKQMRMEPELAGETQAAKNRSNLATFLDPALRDEIQKGGQVTVGDIHAGADPYAKVLSTGPKEAQSFVKNAQGAYKGLNDQFDASKATLDALNQGNSTSDKLALINEARLAAGAGGSRAISHMVSILSGDPTMEGDLQKGINWLQSSATPTMTASQRNAIRESVFNRLPQLEDQHNQVSTQLAQQAPIVAPHTDTTSLLQSITSPASQRLSVLKKMQADYAAKRSQMTPNNPVSNPAIANPNPTMVDRLKSFFSPQKGSPQASQPPPESDPIAAELAKRAAGSLGK